MNRSDFYFKLPPELIAQHPSPSREGSRLLRLGFEPEIVPFPNLLDCFQGDELLVLNDTRVVPARVQGHKETGGAVELFFVEPLGPGRVAALLRGKRLRSGTPLLLPEVEAKVGARLQDGTTEVFLPVEDLWAWLERVGEIPLPPYIQRAPEEADRERYQTTFAERPGAVAAPTAGLHFKPSLLADLEAKGVEIRRLTLHVGPGTFRPVRAEDPRDHVMHSERYSLPPETQAALKSGRPVVAVGTTVVRALESYALDPSAKRTEIFILPGFEFQVVDGLLTNFHLPESTLLMLVCAFAGQEASLAAYQRAIAAKMRFFSYGDAMLLKREGGRWS